MRIILALLLSGLAVNAAGPMQTVNLVSDLTSIYPSSRTTYRTLGVTTVGDFELTWRWVDGATNEASALAITNSFVDGRFLTYWLGDVEVFGARGDGTTDDTAALQAAINAAPEYSGGLIRLASFAKYKVVGPLFLTNDNLTLDGQFSTLLLNDNSGEASLRTIPLGGIETWTNRTALIATNITIKDLTVKAQDMSTGKNLVFVHGIDGFRLENLNIYGNGTNASWALSLDGWNGQVRNVFVDNRGALLQDGIHVFGGTNIVISDCIVYAGDDAFPVGSDNNRDIADIVISDSIGVSSHAWPMKVYTALTGPSAEMPDQTVQRVSYQNMNVRAGQYNNGALAIFDWAFDIYSGDRTNEEPPRLITDVSIDGVMVTSPQPPSGSKTVEQPDLYIVGGDRVAIRNFNNPTPWNNTLLVAPRNLTVSDSYFGAPVRTNQPTVQWLATFGGHTNFSDSITFDRVRFGLRNDVATFNIAPYYTTNITFRDCSFETDDDGAPALYLGPSVTYATVTGNRFVGTSTNAAIYYGAPVGATISGPNWYDPNWTRSTDGLKYQGSIATNIWHVEVGGKEWRPVGTNTDFQVTANGVQISKNRSGTTSTPPLMPLALEVNAAETIFQMRRDNGTAAYYNLAGGRLNMVSTGGQFAMADNYTTSNNKVSFLGGVHYDTAQLPMTVFYNTMQSAAQTVNIGGGTSGGNAATAINFWAGVTTTSGAGNNMVVMNTNGLTVVSGYGLTLAGDTITDWNQVNTVSDSSTIDFTKTDRDITASVVADSIGTGQISAAAETYFLARGNHTGTQSYTTISDFWAGLTNSLVAGANITLTPSSPTITISATAGGGTVTNGVFVNSSPITDPNFVDNNSLTWPVSGTNVNGHITDRDFGDITVSSTGTAMALDNDTVTSAKIVDSTIVSADIANGTITGTDIASETVTTSNILNGTVGNDDLATSAVTSNKVATATLTPDKLINSGVSAGTYNYSTITVNDQGLITSASSGSPSGNWILRNTNRVSVLNTNTETHIANFSIPANTLNNAGDVVSLHVPAKFINLGSGGDNGYIWRLYLDSAVTEVLYGNLTNAFGLSSSYRGASWDIRLKRMENATTLAVEVDHSVSVGAPVYDGVDVITQKAFDDSEAVSDVTANSIQVELTVENNASAASLGVVTWGYTAKKE